MKPLDLVLSNLPWFPVYLAWLVGAILALVRWHRHPRVSLVMLLATALFILGMLLGVASFWVISQQVASGWSAREVGYAAGIINLVRSLLNTIAYTLLLIAVFGWRGGRRPDAEAEDDFPGDAARRPPGA